MPSPFARFDGAAFVRGGTPRRWDGAAWHPAITLPFTPEDLSPDFYFNPRTLALADGARVSTWPDSGPSGHHGVASGATRPTYQADIANGQPGVYFDGSDEMHLTNLGDLLSLDDSFTMYIVIKPTGSLAGYPIMFTWPDNAGWNWIIEFDPSGNIFWGANSGSYRLYQAGVALDQVSTIVLRKTSATTGQMWKNGVEIEDFSTNGGGLQAVPAMSGDVRMASYNVPGFGITGHFFEVLHASRTHTTDERQKVEGFIAWTYGTVSQLPSDHPYKTEAP